MDLSELEAMLVPSDRMGAALRERGRPNVFQNVPPETVKRHKEEGWEFSKKLKRSVKMQRPKRPDVAFEDAVWTVFARLGFTQMNRDRKFVLPYGRSDAETRQIDVFAADSESILVVECKASVASEPRREGFKSEIEAFVGVMNGIRRTLRGVLPNHKVKFVFATSGYALTKPALQRLESKNILHLDTASVQYYAGLEKHLGLAARYQLLGSVFGGMKIPGIEETVPAIKGKMGGHVYYSFSISPERLLKIGYVSHRNRANSGLVPTYQRLIRKSRLKRVADFIEQGGHFPNSVIVNVDSPRGLTFDQASMTVDGSESRIGVLHLPQSYKSAYIIDGQHRLYGYAAANRVNSDEIPVIAFVNLPRTEQVRLFMQINENQKAVPKNLRNTLNADLLWGSDDLREQIRALKLRIAQDLGEESSSPLFSRVIVGEEAKTPDKCITIEAIRIGLDRSNFFGVFSKNSVTDAGTFYKGSNSETSDALVPFLEGCLFYVRDHLPEQWKAGNRDDGFVFINSGLESLIRAVSDIVDHLQTGGVNPRTAATEELVEAAAFYLDPLIKFLKELPQEDRSELRQSYGTGGRVKYWRTLQKAISDARDDFNPPGLAEYWSDQAKVFNTASFEMIRELETFMEMDFADRLQGKYGDEWFKKAVPSKVYTAANAQAAELNRKLSKAAEKKPWECFMLIDYRTIITFDHQTWLELFEKRYTKPGEEKLPGGWKERTKWIEDLNRLRNVNFHSYSVTQDEYQFLRELTEWLIDDKVDNDLD